ncbi:hypothetical protein PSE_0797 [Pseudovibrio sp. FO-BEG1]|uniref:Lipoprotein n=1 Tax=Pseudovibrio denitrificans TaxID=258256 RepID=A0A1I7B8S1_9HYPH|nr:MULTISPECIES: hypothetical protein [Pseudovibrio]AEV35309.1 hypothetical protein PSE_0797 [Pseudovibrio sp. FO-BEG1]SFT83567.1 hypothetical protein SAMN05444141_103767 [Pseudovibrio denitrificans]
MRRYFTTGLCLIAIAGLAGCQTTTPGQGRLGGKDVQFEVTENFFGGGGAATTATLPDGEVFTGKLVTAKSETTNVGESDFGGFDDFDDFDDFDGFDDGPFLVSTFSTTYSPYARGVLFSAKRSMRCVVTLSNPAGGFSDGGVGQCKLSNGGTFPVEF